MAPSVATFNKVRAASGNNMKERFQHQTSCSQGRRKGPILRNFPSRKCIIDVSDSEIEYLFWQI